MRFPSVKLLYENLSNPEDGLAEVEVREQRLGGSRVADASAIENVSVIGERQDEVEVVLDDEDRDLVSQLVERLEDFFYYRGCESLERLVEEQQPNVTGERARDGTICCSPPESRSALVFSFSRTRGK